MSKGSGQGISQRVKTVGIGLVVLSCALLLWVAWSTPGPKQAKKDGAEEAPLEVDPFEEAALTGRVLDPDGEILVGATVMVRQAGSPNSARTTRTDKQGRYGFADLPSGAWRLDAAAPDMTSPGPEQIRAVAIDIDDETSLEVDLTLRRPVKVSGRVFAGSKGLGGLPIEARYEKAIGVSGALAPFVRRRVGTTDPKGRFAIHLAPGQFVLVVRDRERGQRESQMLTLADGAQRSGVNINYSPGGKVEGLVKNETGSNLRATVELTGRGLSKPLRVMTNAAGHFTLKDVAAGTYTLSAQATGFSKSSVAITVTADEVTPQDLVLRAERAIAGRVVDHADKPVAKARVVISWGASEATVSCDTRGEFRWRRDGVPIETVRVMALSPRHAPSPWETGGREELMILRLGQGGFISGRVVDPDGSPVFPAAVAIESMDVGSPNPYKAREIRATRVNGPEGVFKLGPLRPGRYTLRGESQKHGPGLARDVLVSSDHETANIEIKLTHGGVLRGTVLDGSNNPIDKARVIVWVPRAVMPPRVTVSAVDGGYTIRGLPRGRFSVRVRKHGYLTTLVSGIEIEEGSEVHRDLIVRRGKSGERFAFQGIGATLTRRGGGIAVGNLIASSPAKAAGLKSGDVIRAVDGQATRGKGIREVVEWIRGEPGSAVTLEVVRGGQPMRIEIVRSDVVMKRGSR
ncbi:MAG: carboxypeptidase regulatory-like domain-containing protein [Myxococcales bacterium]|nr:carboxypeptidase regulatory-like domain-containing protein [Myxococcales bacterium]